MGVENGAGLAGGRAGQQQVQVAEIDVRARVEVLGADVAAADDGDAAVGDPGLVVHAVVDAEDPLHHLQQAPQALAVAERVVQAHFDARMGVERQQLRVHPLGVHVVQQQPHPHPALGRRVHVVHQQVADHVVVPHVVLQIEAAAGLAGDHRARGEGFQAVDQVGRAALPRVRGELCLERPVQRGLRGPRRQRGGGLADRARGEPVAQQQATGDQQQERGEDAGAQAQQAPAAGRGRFHACILAGSG